MRIGIREQIEIRAPRARVFDHTNRAESLVSFEGYGPIPGIRSAEYLTPGPPGLGARRRVLNTDGSSHVEEITVFEPPARHTSRVREISSPFRLLVRWLDDEWRFSETPTGTFIERRFVADARPFALPVAILLLPLLRRAVRRDLSNLSRALEPGAMP